MTREILVWGAAVCLFVAGSGEVLSESPDPWRGKSRQDVLSLLGEPTKSKTGRGEETLTYKLIRLTLESSLAPGVLIVDLPGVGLVGKIERDPETRADDTMYQPTEFDEEGRPIAGGFKEEPERSISWDTETGEVERDWDPSLPDDLARASKLTVKFRLNAEGLVEDWSVSPKKAARTD